MLMILSMAFLTGALAIFLLAFLNDPVVSNPRTA
jgi:hypothetical protein